MLVPTAGGKPGQMAMSKHNYDIAYTDSGYKQESNAVFALLSTTLTDALTLNNRAALYPYQNTAGYHHRLY